MREYSLPRQIWRVLYPALLYLGISLFVNFIGILAGVVANIVKSGITPAFDEIMEVAISFSLKNSLLIALVGYAVAVAVFIPIWKKTQKRYPRWNGGKFSIPTALCSAGAALGFNMIISIIISVTGLLELFPSHNNITDTITNAAVPLQIIAVGFVGPIAEELCFRGVTLSRMSKTKVWIAVAVQTVLFGLVHLNPLQIIYAAMLGVFLGFITVRYRSIIYAIIAHIAFNTYTVVLGAIKSEAVLSAIGIALIFITVMSFIGLFKCKKAEPYIEPEEAPPGLEQIEL